MTVGELNVAAPVLRPVGPEDASFLFDVFAGTRVEELAPLGWDDATKDAFLRMQFAARDRDYRSRFPGARSEVVLVDGRPAGRLSVDRRPAEIHVLDIALLPDFRGKGIGGRLLQEVLDEAAAAGQRVTIGVERFNRARRLYHRLGFRTEAEAEAEDDVYLQLQWVPPPAPT